MVIANTCKPRDRAASTTRSGPEKSLLPGFGSICDQSTSKRIQVAPALRTASRLAPSWASESESRAPLKPIRADCAGAAAA